MRKAVVRDPIYRGRRFPAEIIELCVRWYITYRLSYRDLVAMNGEDRGTSSLKHLWDLAIVGSDAASPKPEAEPSGASTGNAPGLTPSRTKRQLRRIPGGVWHIRPVRGARKFSEGSGLYLLVAPTGGRYWRYNYRFKGQQKTLALGVYPGRPAREGASPSPGCAAIACCRNGSLAPAARIARTRSRRAQYF